MGGNGGKSGQPDNNGKAPGGGSAAGATPGPSAASGAAPQQANGAGGAAALALASASPQPMDVAPSTSQVAAKAAPEQSGGMDVVTEDLSRGHLNHVAGGAAVVPKMVAELKGGGSGGDGTLSFGSGGSNPSHSLNSNATTSSPTTMHMSGAASGGSGGYKPVRGSSNGTKSCDQQRHAPCANASSHAATL